MPKVDNATIDIVIKTIKELTLKEEVIENPEMKKWYKFGAYDSLHILVDKLEGMKNGTKIIPR